MKDKLLQIRVDDNFFSKLEYLKDINGFKTVAETVRKLCEKEFRKETTTARSCDFGDAEKIRAMLKAKYPCADFTVNESRNLNSSLHDIEILEKGTLLLALEFSTDGYTIKSIGSFLLLDFVGDVFKCLSK